MPNDAWDSGLRVNIKNTVDLKKIQEVAQQAAVDILVGFPSGREHVPTLHKNDFDKPNEKRRGKYQSYTGGDPMDEQPLETAELAKMLHYGTQTIPARPFLEDGIRQNIGKLKRAMQEEAKKAIEGKKPNWDKVGTMAVGAIQEFVRGDYYKQRVPNSKYTQKYKGGDTPLIDGADLINSLVYVKSGEELVTTKGSGSYNQKDYNAADFRS
jgi:HK97 gp10 family phage protein